jgi:ADP-heptose:LPS heptosyltransferase
VIVLLSPWSRKAGCEGRWNPKDYPYWREVVAALVADGIQVRQLSCLHEPDVAGCASRSDDLSFSQIKQLIRDCGAWCSVDSFFHHLAWSVGKRGVAVFGPSDPLVFGHPENVNLLKDRKFLRERQFGLWSEVAWRPEIFPDPGEVIKALRSLR